MAREMWPTCKDCTMRASCTAWPRGMVKRSISSWQWGNLPAQHRVKPENVNPTCGQKVVEVHCALCHESLNAGNPARFVPEIVDEKGRAYHKRCVVRLASDYVDGGGRQ